MPSLLDAFTRQQVFLESYKLSQFQDFVRLMPQVKASVRAIFAALAKDAMGQLTRRELMFLQQRLHRAILPIFSPYTQRFLYELQSLAWIEALLAEQLMADGVSLDQQEQSRRSPPLFGWSALRSKGGLWDAIVSEPSPADGVTTGASVSAIAQTISTAIVQRATQGYSNAETVRQTVEAIVGTDETFGRDGLLNRLVRQIGGQLSTIVQNVASLAQNAMASAFATKYQWISVLDDRTTEICRSRNGRTYTYDNGPLPPAHYNCRSRTVPYFDTPLSDIPSTFLAWLLAQPAAVQEAIGTVPDAGRFRASRPLTLAQLEGTLRTVTRD